MIANPLSLSEFSRISKKSKPSIPLGPDYPLVDPGLMLPQDICWFASRAKVVRRGALHRMAE